MAEYIKKEAAKKIFADIPMWGSCAVSYIDSLPVADVAPVVHARWEHLSGDEWCCTNCGEVIHTEGSWEKPDKKFCYECGAKMDQEA